MSSGSTFVESIVEKNGELEMQKDVSALKFYYIILRWIAAFIDHKEVNLKLSALECVSYACDMENIAILCDRYDNRASATTLSYTYKVTSYQLQHFALLCLSLFREIIRKQEVPNYVPVDTPIGGPLEDLLMYLK